MNKYIQFLFAIAFDFAILSAVVWSLHLILTWPWILVGIAMILSVGVRYEDITRN